ncbi:MAG TPA: two-component regulator propeller domain-containing protein [Chitinophagaceae bacterium]
MPALKLICVAAFMTLAGYQAFSQDYPFIKYTPKDGLINNRVRNFYQDSKGRIFITTANGLSVYDGARFLNYTVDDGLGNPLVNDVLELSADSLLIATNTSVLNVWVQGSIKVVKTKNNFCPVINRFYRDKNNTIYVASDQGIYRFEKDIFTPINIKAHDGNTATSFEEIQDIGNYLWLKRADLTFRFSNLLLIHKETFKSHPFPLDGYVTCALPLKEEQLLLVIANSQLLSLDLKAAEHGLVKYKKLPSRFRHLTKLSLHKIIIDRYHNIWGLTSNSVIRLMQDGKLQIFDKSNGLDVSNIRSITIDNENVLWILTDGSGILKLVNRNVEILSSDIKAIYIDSSGKEWMLGTSDQYLYCSYDDQVQKWRLNSDAGFGGLAMRKKLLLLFDNNSIYQTEPVQQVNRLSVKKIYSDNIEPINYSRAEIGENDNIYIPGHSLTVLNSENIVTRIRLPAYADQLSLDKHQQLWAVSRAGDLLCYQINQDKAADPLTLKFTDKLSIQQPRAIAIDKTGKIWIGTRYDGLYCLEYSNKRIVSKRQWTTANGLTDNFIYHLICDDNNVIWAGTQGGLDKISASGSVVESITRNNNIFQVIYKVMIGKKNDVWAAAIGSIIRITNDASVASDYQPQLQIVRMMSAEKSFPILPDQAVLPSKTRELTFDVAAPSFIDEKRVRFSYMLEGNEEGQWSPPAPEASFRFINLPPAKYTLHIRAVFPVAHYKTQELVYHFTILPPWWNTWWFRTLLIAFFLIVIVLLIKAYYQDKLKKQRLNFEKQQAIQQERTRIAMEMHDDLGSGLTVIRYLAGGLVSNTLPLIKEKALKIETSAKQLVDNMNDIIWTIKSDNNSLSDVLSYIRKQAADMLENVGIDYEFDFPKHPGDLILTNEQKRNILLISKEIVHNVVKHSRATKVLIKAEQNGDIFRLWFSDNGKGVGNGFSSHFGNGMKNMQQRATQIGGRIEIQNNKGTTVIVTIRLA